MKKSTLKDFTTDIHEARNEEGVRIEIMLVHPQVLLKNQNVVNICSYIKKILTA